MCAPRLPQVRGDFDDPIYLPGIADSLPESKVVTVGAFKLGVCHGHQIVPWGDPESLSALAPLSTSASRLCRRIRPCVRAPRRDAAAARL